MKPLQHKLLSLFMILAMVITLLPFGVANADAQYFRFTNFSSNMADPTQVNTDVVQLVGSFNGVSSNSISYQVEQIVNGQSVQISRGTGVNPIIENGNTFKFMNVQLFQGLNKITVYGTNPSGNQVPGVCYVYFSNVPVLYDIKLVDGRVLEAGQPQIVTSPDAVLLLKAPNSDRVTVNGVIAYSAGEDAYIVSDLALKPGLNPLAIVASNETMTYSLNRQLVYFNGFPTAYNNRIENSGGTPNPVVLDNSPTVGPNSGGTLNGRISGQLIFATDNTTPPDPAITLELYDGSNPIPITFATTVTRETTTAGHTVFSYTSTTDANITMNGPWRLLVRGTYGTQNASYPVAFNYRNANTAYISALNQIYNVVETPTEVTYDSSTVFADNTTIFELPIWLEAQIENTFDIADVTLSSTQNGVTVPAAVFNYSKKLTDDGDVAFKINNLPAGEQVLTVTVTSAGGTETQTVRVNYVPAPFIQLNNLYNGKVFNTNGTYPADENDPRKFTTLKGRLVNFNNTGSDPDQSSVQVKINGRSVRLIDHLAPATTIDAQGNFTFVVPSDMLLVNGPNLITVSGVANGVPVTTTYTVYLFSEQVPVITDIKPVPHDPLSPLVNDPNLKFQNTGALQYVTNEKEADILFTVTNVDEVVVTVDGSQLITAENDSSGTLISDDDRVLHIDSYDPLERRYTLRLIKHLLPSSGLRSITIQANLESASVASTLAITRELSPFIILSPKLPNERVVNQNFLNIAIQAEGADSVLIGKVAMQKEADDIFRYELRNMKAGINKVKFTVMRGTQKLDGEFEVNYAASNTIGGQFKTTIPKAGSVKVFNSDLILSLPKNTFLRQVNNTPGQDARTVDLFDSQNILFGIADRTDGRTLKKYNDDGDIRDISPMDIAADLLSVPSHFGYASKLFWVDAGYFDAVTPSQWSTVHGQHPYNVGYEFYTRTANKWMEPSQRGNITLKYNEDIRNVTAPKLSIWRFYNNTWKNLGGVVDTGKKTVTASFDGFGYYAVFYDAYSFNDVIGHSYARNHLETMFAKGVMLPKNNNEFGVYDNITRGEFATMMVKMLDLPLSYDPLNPTFNDVPKEYIAGSLYDYRYIETAVKRGMIRGVGPRLFAPNQSLTREQAAVMIARAMNLKVNPDTNKEIPNLQKLFTDAGTVDYYAVSSITAVAKEGIIVGIENKLTGSQKKKTYRFDPHAFLNRADAAIITEKVMRKMKRL
ncbi:S-layer homology domain-containing protein [Tumebacillus avium]|uniref:S-layer homology domain-containing protein n=1 Tax=Tumebacillus avium TaxID=1903704 RepID=UPI0018DFC178|nr:S-layer homology domain-containing protein [Tumebacillus avium]